MPWVKQESDWVIISSNVDWLFVVELRVGEVGGFKSLRGVWEKEEDDETGSEFPMAIKNSFVNNNNKFC